MISSPTSKHRPWERVPDSRRLEELRGKRDSLSRRETDTHYQIMYQTQRGIACTSVRAHPTHHF
jgi:hypothetical protein